MSSTSRAGPGTRPPRPETVRLTRQFEVAWRGAVGAPPRAARLPPGRARRPARGPAGLAPGRHGAAARGRRGDRRRLVPGALPVPGRRRARRPDLRGVLPPRGGGRGPGSGAVRGPVPRGRRPRSATVLEIHEPGRPSAPARPRYPSAAVDDADFPAVGRDDRRVPPGRGAGPRLLRPGLPGRGAAAGRPPGRGRRSRGLDSREPQTLARLQHTHIVPVYSYRTDPARGLHLLCMPYFGRLTLARVLADPAVRGRALGRRAGRGARPAPARRRPPATLGGPCGPRRARTIPGRSPGGAPGSPRRSSTPTTAASCTATSSRRTSWSPTTACRCSWTSTWPATRGRGRRAASADRLGGTLAYMAPEHLESLLDEPGRRARPPRRPLLTRPGPARGDRLAAVRAGPDAAAATPRRVLEARRAGPPRTRECRRPIPPALEAVVRRCLEPDPVGPLRYGGGAGGRPPGGRRRRPAPVRPGAAAEPGGRLDPTQPTSAGDRGPDRAGARPGDGRPVPGRGRPAPA